MSTMQERADAVRALIDEVRGITGQDAVTRPRLERVSAALVGLARRTELFPTDEFIVPEGRSSSLYRLAEDADHGFALYASAGRAGRGTPPHNHTTWAVIAGVYGKEHNVLFERTDDRSVPGRGSLARTGEVTLGPGEAVGYLPDDFHAIETVGEGPCLHLHLYGRSLEHLPERICFESPTGGAYQVFPPNPTITALELAPEKVRALIEDGEEIALLDVREEGEFSAAHLLYAVSMPLSRMELMADALLPRRTVRVVMIDRDGGIVAQRGARRLFDLGWKNIAVLKGGVEGWRRAGYELFSGVNVPSKAFGEFVEHRYGTPHIEAAELKRRTDAGEPVLIVDSRPLSEFEAMSIPGGIDCPGAELVYRVPGLVASPDTLVVVNCAGRTRSIIGAQSLINAGLPNRVVALKDGTMGWHLAGLELAHGRKEAAPPPPPQALAQARSAAARVAERFGVRRIDRSELERFVAEQDRRSLFLLDVRSPEEYLAGHLPGWRSAPGGQLVQATDRYIGTLRSRLVLGDSDGVRATVTASWLIQMGWDEVVILDRPFDSDLFVAGPEPVRILGESEAVSQIDPAELQKLMAGGDALLIDLASSLQYRDAHIAGAWWAIRSRLDRALEKLPASGSLILTSPDGIVARLAAGDLKSLVRRPVMVLAGGTAAWRDAGLPMEDGATRMADDPVDVWYRPYDRAGGVEEAMRTYLTWEVDLPRQIERDGSARFRAFPQGGTR